MACCRRCDRYFETDAALERHLQTSSRHSYCLKCRRFFDNSSAKQQHVLNSSRHHVCPECPHDTDFPAEDDLDEHRATTHHYCTSCQRGFNSLGQLAQYDISKHKMCEDCGIYLNPPQDLSSHGRRHQEKTTICLGCPKKFSSSSAILLHLESGCCESAVCNDDIVELAFECHQSKYYVCDDDDYDFECPTCETPFWTMSALFQHVESGSCEEDLNGGSPLEKFRRFLQSRIR